jgi:hypothetical protein
MMTKLLLGAAVAFALAAPANAAVLTLQNVSANSPGDFTFNYQATLGPDEGVRAGDKFIIYDFGGYIDGSIFSTSANLATSVENSSPSGIVAPGFTDDPTIANLVFTYNGPDFRNTGGPLATFDFPSIGARSTLGGTILDAFFSLTTKNNPTREQNTPIYTLGSVAVPFNAIPEPTSWAMMLGGFGVIGLTARRRTRAGARVLS